MHYGLTAQYGVGYVGLYLIATAFITLGAQLLMRETKGIVLDAVSEEPALEPGNPTAARNAR